MKVQQTRKIYIIFLLLSILFLGIGVIIPNEVVLIILAVIGFICFFIAMIIAAIYWRCPSCRKSLPIQGIFGIEYCPYCAEYLEE